MELFLFSIHDYALSAGGSTVYVFDPFKNIRLINNISYGAIQNAITKGKIKVIYTFNLPLLRKIFEKGLKQIFVTKMGVYFKSICSTPYGDPKIKMGTVWCIFGQNRFSDLDARAGYGHNRYTYTCCKITF